MYVVLVSGPRKLFGHFILDWHDFDLSNLFLDFPYLNHQGAIVGNKILDLFQVGLIGFIGLLFNWTSYIEDLFELGD